ncbi:MAG: SDR family NAD(P)-dependent oxidoreductase [Candidatus Micrarchaeota archaeon]|nr:SDR family NAD(P)-dependent oxidoreductase [Candidatus Micrarchaeota archaeon]
MRTSGNTILITGGATGIGFALAERLDKMGNTVIICGRRQNKLDEAKRKVPGLHPIRCDISNRFERVHLFKRISLSYRSLNILINNAGIQRAISFRNGDRELDNAEDEIETNLKAQIHLSALFIPLLAGQSESAMINVSSGLGFVPLARFPVYCATKAAIHSFTMSLRHQLKGTSIKVFELIPPIVHDTELKGKPIEKADWTLSSAEVAEAAVRGLENDQYEIPVGPTKRWLASSKADLDRAFLEINQ